MTRKYSRPRSMREKYYEAHSKCRFALRSVKALAEEPGEVGYSLSEGEIIHLGVVNDILSYALFNIFKSRAVKYEFPRSLTRYFQQRGYKKDITSARWFFESGKTLPIGIVHASNQT